MAGAGATSYDVYLGTTTGPGTFQGNQATMTFDPGTMAGGIQHYWRIDSINFWGKTIGEDWTFYTATPPPP
jgi:hypothetical protein